MAVVAIGNCSASLWKPGHLRPGQSFFSAYAALRCLAVKLVDRCSARERSIHFALGLHRIPDFRDPDCFDALLMQHERLDSGREAGGESRPFALLRILLYLIGRHEDRGTAALPVLTALEIV